MNSGYKLRSALGAAWLAIVAGASAAGLISDTPIWVDATLVGTVVIAAMFALSWPVKAALPDSSLPVRLLVTALLLLLALFVMGFISLCWVLRRYGSPFH